MTSKIVDRFMVGFDVLWVFIVTLAYPLAWATLMGRILYIQYGTGVPGMATASGLDSELMMGFVFTCVMAHYSCLHDICLRKTLSESARRKWFVAVFILSPYVAPFYGLHVLSTYFQIGLTPAVRTENQPVP